MNVSVPPPLRSPPPITMRQMLLGALGSGFLSASEAEAWAQRNAVPAFIEALIQAQPEDARAPLRVTLLTMAQVDRAHPMVRLAADAAEAVLGREITDAEIDAFWRECASL